MNALSRREEEFLEKSTKERAIKECDDIVKEFAACTQGRTISLAWSCKDKYKLVQECMSQYTSPQSMDLVKAEYIRLRDIKKFQESQQQAKR